MADNVTFQTTVATPASGTVVAADDIGGAAYQRVKISHGADGSATDTSTAAPLPVVQTGTPALPADAATQTTAAAILAKLLAAPATEAKQDTGNTSLSSLDTKTPALGQAIAAASVPVILPSATITTLTPPAAITGFATSAKQDTGNTSIASIDTKTPSLGQASAAASVPVILPTATITTLTPPAAITGFATETTLAAQSAKLPAVLGQTTKAASLSVALASNQDALPITDNSGSLTVDGTVAVSAVSGVVDVTPTSPAANDYLPVRLTDGSGFVTAGGGTQYAEDAAHVSADLGTMALAVQKATAVALGGDGDYTPLITDANGRLHVRPGPNDYQELTGSATSAATFIASTDVSGYRSFTIQVTGTFSATIILEGSNDNSTWVQYSMQPLGLGAPTVQATAAGILFGQLVARYLRVRASAWASGTAVCTVELSPLIVVHTGQLDTNTGGFKSSIVSSGGVAFGGTTLADGIAPGSNINTTSGTLGFNGTNWDRWRNNNAVSALASAARTSTANADVITYNAKTFRVILNITVAPNTASTLTPAIRIKDSISSNYLAVLTGAAITGTVVTGAVPSTTSYVVGSGVITTANVSAPEALARTMNVIVTHSNSDSWTYSVSVELGV